MNPKFLWIIFATLISVLLLVLVGYLLWVKTGGDDRVAPSAAFNPENVISINGQVEIGNIGHWSVVRLKNVYLVKLIEDSADNYRLVFAHDKEGANKFTLTARSHVDYSLDIEDSRKLYLFQLKEELLPGDSVNLMLAYIEPESALDNQRLREYTQSLPQRVRRPDIDRVVEEELVYLGKFGSKKIALEELLDRLSQKNADLDEDTILLKQISKNRWHEVNE
jgi:hypothetical protein